jgi:hypothetical protein
MSKITANDSHRHDDIADTLADAIKISLIDKSIRIDTKQNELLSASIMRPQLDRLQIETDLFYGGKY